MTCQNWPTTGPPSRARRSPYFCFEDKPPSPLAGGTGSHRSSFRIQKALLKAILASHHFSHYPNDVELQSLVTTCRPSRSPSSYFTDPVSPKPDFRLLIGILTRADLYERRHLLRLVYSLQPRLATAVIDIRLFFCNLTKEDQRVLVALEILHYDNIIILNCTENMDNGKTYA